MLLFIAISYNFCLVENIENNLSLLFLKQNLKIAICIKNVVFFFRSLERTKQLLFNSVLSITCQDSH